MEESDRAEICHLYLAGSGEAVYSEDLVMVRRPLDSIQELLELSKKGSYLLVRGLWRGGRSLRVSGFGASARAVPLSR
jgi:hypothetical protein